MEYYSAIEKNKMISFAATWMQLENIIQREVRHKEKHKCHIISLILWNLKYDTNEPLYETEVESET